MFIEVVEMRYDKVKKEWVEHPLFVNPIHVATVEDDNSNLEPVRCIVRTQYRTILVKGTAKDVTNSITLADVT